MNKKSIFYTALFGLFIILGIWAFFMSKNIIGNTEITANESSGDEKMDLQELIITETKDGQKFWEVYADRGHYDNGTDIAVLYNITGNFYKEGEVILSMISPKAIYNSNEKKITLQGGAEAATNKEIHIQAEEICWTGSKDNINASGNVKIIRDKQVMTISDKSSFDTDFTNLEISGDSNTYVYSLD